MADVKDEIGPRRRGAEVGQCAPPRPFAPDPIGEQPLIEKARRAIIGLAKQRGLKVIERAIFPQELSDFEECFITGTAAEVTPVSEIDGYKFAVGPITKTLMADFSALTRPAKVRAAVGG